ncbi:peptidoglycan D,D-transpeptidase FtsI family protein [Actinorugispora endophytica]|uniref:Cell elongation-specific peptidoglycan D,D-transpeptidase n=1 Tax=Actinorugispora endophytica TaxID=1605990 RepID=A0A4R6V1B7_9ACTN|nr:penicillin-binding protein 2 [Actinorugispora endophytica]TDQ52318.1 cell elongation-specific peptidoglycan D,D-transpeptidase [Actinorugispora endophytica]
MNKPIRRLSLFALALFGVLLLNVTWIQAVQAEWLQDHEFNRRDTAERLTTPRGPIQVGNEQIASSSLVEESGQYQRAYPEGEVYAHPVGVFNPMGNFGIESTENTYLDGSHSSLLVRNFLDMLTGTPAQGATVVLTLDPAAQQAALEGLKANATNGRAAAVAVDPSTGAVLAAASIPTYDPNEVADLSDTTASVENWNALAADENQPLLNRAFNERYPPGSTFKIVTAAAALEAGNTIESTIAAPESIPLGGSSLPNAFGGPCNGGAPDSIAHSIEISCNTSMANWAIELGDQAMHDQATAFGFNSGPMDIPVPVTESLAPLEPDNNIRAQTGIGQGNLEATPLQMAMVAAGVANGGTVMQPYLVQEILGPDMSELDSTSPEVFSEAVSSDTAEQLTQAMIQVTEGDEGSGLTGAIPGMQVAGKTGTAETGDGDTHNWFISFAPADDPQVAVAVVIERGNQSGGTLAAPVAKAIMEAVINE